MLEPGSYIVVPRTTGCGIGKPLEADEDVKVHLLNNNKPTEILLSTLKDIFAKFDIISNGVIDYKEFELFKNIIGAEITERDF